MKSSSMIKRGWKPNAKSHTSAAKFAPFCLKQKAGQGQFDVFTLDEADLIDFTNRYDQIAISIRTYMDLIALRELLGKHKDLHEILSVKVSEHDQKALKCVNNNEITKQRFTQGRFK